MNRFLRVLSLALLTSACAHQVAFQDINYRVSEQPRPEALTAVVSQAERARVVPVRSVMTGVAHSWDAEPGAMLVQVAEVELPQMFERFRLLDSAEGQDGSYVLHLAVPRYTFANFRASLTLHARLMDPDGMELLDRLYEAEGPGRGGRMFFGGAFAMKSAMRTSSIEAFQQAFAQLRADLGERLDAQHLALAAHDSNDH